MPPQSRLAGRCSALLLAAIVLGGCATAGAPGVSISGAWARPSGMVAGAAAVYLVIENTGDEADTLVGGSSPAAAALEVHETYVVEEPGMSGGGGMASPMASPGAMLGMRPIPRLEIPAGERVSLEPGGYHVMLIDLVADLEPGATVEVTLRFERAGEISVTAEVRAG